MSPVPRKNEDNAIPAVIAYNRYANDVERLHNRYDTFIEEFTAILRRQAHA